MNRNANKKTGVIKDISIFIFLIIVTIALIFIFPDKGDYK